MSQQVEQPAEQQDMQTIPDEERHFAEGLAAALDDGDARTDQNASGQEQADPAEQEASPQEEDARTTAAPIEQEDSTGQPEPSAVPQQPPVVPAVPTAPAPVSEMPPDSSPAEPQPSQAVTLPEELQQEYARLEKLDPEAARMALEDSPTGEAMRYRLEQYGAELALDHASLVRMQRRQVQERDARRQEQTRQEALARHMHFMNVMQHDHPEFHSLLTGGDMAAQVRFRNDVLHWIESKPYAEAAPLMETFNRSRDPQEVSRLLTQFRQERDACRPDPTGALAVPGRGGTVAPAGIGSKDDFGAGLSLSLSSKE